MSIIDLANYDHRGPFLTDEEAKDYSSSIPASTYIVIVDKEFYVIVEGS